MRIFSSSLFCSAIILNSIGFSSQSNRVPDDEPDPGSHRCGPSSSPAASRHCDDTTHSLTTPVPSASFSSPFRERSRSPTLRNTFPSVLGFSFEDLATIRLMPHEHPNRVFELRIFCFPPHKQIGLRSRYNDLKIIPAREKIVMSTSNGDVCAVLEKAPNKATNIRALYTPVSKRLVRVKININSGAIEKLTVDEIEGCPPTAHGGIVKSYGVFQFQNTAHPPSNPLEAATSSTPAEPRPHHAFDSSTLRKLFPRILGYDFEELPFIRLAPRINPNRIYELRIYVFPPDKPIRLRTKTRILIPMPTEHKIVLSTHNGDICAILDRTSNKQIFIRSMFTPIFGMAERAKINMNSGVVEEMNADEIAECPLSSRGSIKDSYRVFRV